MRRLWVGLSVAALLGLAPALASGTRADPSSQVLAERVEARWQHWKAWWSPPPSPSTGPFLHIDGHHPDQPPQTGRRISVATYMSERKKRNPPMRLDRPRFPVHPRDRFRRADMLECPPDSGSNAP